MVPAGVLVMSKQAWIKKLLDGMAKNVAYHQRAAVFHDLKATKYADCGDLDLAREQRAIARDQHRLAKDAARRFKIEQRRRAA
jgi:hypothetical protein